MKGPLEFPCRRGRRMFRIEGCSFISRPMQGRLFLILTHVAEGQGLTMLDAFVHEIMKKEKRAKILLQLVGEKLRLWPNRRTKHQFPLPWAARRVFTGFANATQGL